jgi:hypothetical protein
VYRYLLWPLLALLLSACALRRAPGFDSGVNLLTGEQLADTHAASVYDAVLRLRPGFLRVRGPTSVLIPGTNGPALWVDESYLGDVGELRDIPTRDVVSVRYFPAWDAATRYGSRYSQGMLVVDTRP